MLNILFLYHRKLFWTVVVPKTVSIFRCRTATHRFNHLSAKVISASVAFFKKIGDSERSCAREKPHRIPEHSFMHQYFLCLFLNVYCWNPHRKEKCPLFLLPLHKFYAILRYLVQSISYSKSTSNKLNLI